MTFREVETLFHECGHGLQHMLTKASVGDVAGINGVEWDALELPPLFMENWEGLKLLGAHFFAQLALIANRVIFINPPPLSGAMIAQLSMALRSTGRLESLCLMRCLKSSKRRRLTMLE